METKERPRYQIGSKVLVSLNQGDYPVEVVVHDAWSGNKIWVIDTEGKPHSVRDSDISIIPPKSEL
ncbi:hypothetical protein A2Z22_04640 [Candidatus Woesebacteria bacterium RBG_16_34_12]|uniref:Uncharacterized protein n=1 Tax=Candidatus Woesebacteria bacterium RBG_16_34_12 TaxID=1802480 RepID=A0A1F7XBN7_9BACT|nr:MAG: hypothetical protein A2Z22_04640 [Candidatus Woesebacteria bacterium RBG_16_34_12]